MYSKAFNLICCIIFAFGSVSLSHQNSAILCDNRMQEFTTETGTIISYNYPNYYANNLSCHFRIGVELDKLIIVNFELFETQGNHDFLNIYDGPNTTSTLISSHSGNEKPFKIVSTSNYLYLKFTTDYNINKNGFKLNYKSIKKHLAVNLTKSQGIIRSPEYPSYYPRGIHYTWRLSAPADNLILLKFNDFHIGLSGDKFEIDNKNTLLVSYRGLYTQEPFLSYTNELVLKFTTVSDNKRIDKPNGFEISYKFVETNKYYINRFNSHPASNYRILCDGRIEDFTSKTGIITSYNYPNEYANNLNCKFRISAQTDEKIIVDFETFSTETTHDILNIYDSYTKSYSLDSSNSGHSLPARIVSRSNYLYFNFITDSNHTRNGFKLNYKTIKKVSVINLTDNEGIIQSPEYPNYYPAGISYSWKILAPINNLIMLEFKYFQTQGIQDQLEIIEVLGHKNRTLAKYYGFAKPKRLLSNSNELILKFQSKYYKVEQKGFEISYKFIQGSNHSINAQADSISADYEYDDYSVDRSTSHKTQTLSPFDSKLHAKIVNLLNESIKNQIESDDLVEKHKHLKLELEKLKLELSNNKNKNGITIFVFILLLIIFGFLIFYFVHKKIKSIKKFNENRKESKIPLIVLNNDCGKSDITID